MIHERAKAEARSAMRGTPPFLDWRQRARQSAKGKAVKPLKTKNPAKEREQVAQKRT